MKSFKDLINDCESLLETDSGDIASVPSRIGVVQKRLYPDIKIDNITSTSNTTNINGKYVGIKVKNKDMLTKYFNKQNIKVPKDLHTTIAYSKKNFNYVINESDVVIKPEDMKGFDLFGDNKNILVMLINSPELTSRFNTTIDSGAVYDYKEYQPHITLSYDYNGTVDDLSNLILPDFDIILGNEYEEDLDESFDIGSKPVKMSIPNMKEYAIQHLAKTYGIDEATIRVNNMITSCDEFRTFKVFNNREYIVFLMRTGSEVEIYFNDYDYVDNFDNLNKTKTSLKLFQQIFNIVYWEVIKNGWNVTIAVPDGRDVVYKTIINKVINEHSIQYTVSDTIINNNLEIYLKYTPEYKGIIGISNKIESNIKKNTA